MVQHISRHDKFRHRVGLNILGHRDDQKTLRVHETTLHSHSDKTLIQLKRIREEAQWFVAVLRTRRRTCHVSNNARISPCVLLMTEFQRVINFSVSDIIASAKLPAAVGTEMNSRHALRENTGITNLSVRFSASSTAARARQTVIEIARGVLAPSFALDNPHSFLISSRVSTINLSMSACSRTFFPSDLCAISQRCALCFHRAAARPCGCQWRVWISTFLSATYNVDPALQVNVHQPCRPRLCNRSLRYHPRSCHHPWICGCRVSVRCMVSWTCLFGLMFFSLELSLSRMACQSHSRSRSVTGAHVQRRLKGKIKHLMSELNSQLQQLCFYT